jgi:hypothetical protein
MKILAALTLTFVGLYVVVYFVHWNHWYVEPAPNGLWRECLMEDYPFDRSGGCGSPISYDEAYWWVKTEGGKKVRP